MEMFKILGQTSYETRRKINAFVFEMLRTHRMGKIE